MAERKRRTPSQKIKPGTPHPTKAHTVRGFDGRWVTRKSYNAAKKAREVAKKGGSLVKRVTSAVTKSSKGDLLKIKKGDKGIVRAIKDTYKLGKDTRKSADAVYKAGKVTRKVHDKLVKGGKEFVKGTVEAGKATRRAYDRLKPGGKIVKTKGSKITKYKKPSSRIVKSPGGKVVRSPGGKVVKSSAGKMVKSPGGKLTTRAKVTAQKYKAPKVGKPLRAKTTAGRTAQRTAGQARKTVRDTAKRVRETRAVSNLNRAKLGKDSLKARAGKTTKYLRSLKPRTLAGGLAKGGAYAAIDTAANWAVEQAVDRGFRALEGKNKMSLKEYRAERDARLKAFREGKFKPKAKSTTTTTKKPLKTWKDPYKGPKQPNISTGPYKGGAKAKPIGTAKPGEGKVVPLNKKPFQNRVSGGSAKPKKKKVSVGNMIGATASVPKKKEAPKKKKLTMRDRMRAKNVAIHGEDAIKSVEKYNKGWQAARKAGKLKEFKKKNKARRYWQVGRR